MTTEFDRILQSPPTNARLLIGDAASYPTMRELRDMRGDQADPYFWTGPKQVQLGDLLFFYFKAPHKSVQFAARATSIPFFDAEIGVNAVRSVDPNQWWIEHSPLVELDPIPFKDLHRTMGGFLNLRGKPSHYLAPEVVQQILNRIPERNRSSGTDPMVRMRPVGSANLPDPAVGNLDRWTSMSGGLLKLASQVVQYVVEPLMRLALQTQGSFQSHKAFRTTVGVPDYVVLEGAITRSVVEVKVGVRVPRNGDWGRSPDFEQVRRYADHLAVPSMLIDSNRAFLIDRDAPAPESVVERRHVTQENFREIGGHPVGQ